MNSEPKTPDSPDGSTEWKAALCASLDALEENVPEPHWIKGEWPRWVQKAWLEILKSCFPDAKLNPDHGLTPRALGAVLGAKVGLLEWLGDENGFAKSKAAKLLEGASANLTAEQKTEAEAAGAKFLEGIEGYCDAFENAQAGALGLAGTAATDEQSEFFSAYISAMQRGKKGLDVGTYGSTATPIYIFLVMNWQAVERVPSVAILHTACGHHLGAPRVGELKTFQKLCQRIGLKLRPRGRPQKNK